MITATRYHDFSYGHRVVGHEGKCAHLHGHNGRVTFVIKANHDETDSVGRVIDFSVIKSLLCNWIEETWDHKFIVYDRDPQYGELKELDSRGVWIAPFNPTAENFAKYLVTVVGPQQLHNTGTTLISVTFEETRKCSATYSL
jgi:6-pyruvoyltetrahydropterin/6-carboxytetrahydropterin synthase